MRAKVLLGRVSIFENHRGFVSVCRKGRESSVSRIVRVLGYKGNWPGFCLWCFEWVLWSLKSVCEVVIDDGEGVRQVVRVLDCSRLLGSLGVTKGW